MKNGYIMIFVALWVIAIIAIMGFLFYSLFSNINNKQDIAISETKEEIDNNIEIVTTSTNEEEKETTYILKDYKGYIAIYVKNNEGEEFLRETTPIVTMYLPELDKQKLKDGIEVIGKEELNKALEDYE